MSGDQTSPATLPRMMLAIQAGAFGGIEQLQLLSIPVPTPRKGEVLVRVGAAGWAPGMRSRARERSGSHYLCR